VRTRISTLVAGVVAIACFSAGPAFAQGQGQDTVRGDVALSYSVLRDSNLARTFPNLSPTFPKGFVLALAGDVNKKLRIVAEFGGNYKTVTVATATNISLQVIAYQGGLRFVPSVKAKIKPFVQFLAGGARATGTLLGSGSSTSNNAFSMQPGVGVDFRVHKGFDGRIQVDYRAVRDSGTTTSEYRVAFGIVIPFGR
jgi:hypothetical protein